MTFPSFWAPITTFLSALIIRSLTAYFIGTHLDDPGWFPFGIYKHFDSQAQGVLDGTGSAFFIDPSDTSAAIYPPGYSLWLVLLYGISGVRSPYFVQIVQVVLDSFSVLLIYAIADRVFNRLAAIAAGFAAALSPLLAFYGATPLADAPTSWLVLGAVLCFILAFKRENVRWAAAAGALVGLSCWFRANGLLLAGIWAIALVLCLRTSLPKRLRLAAVLISAAVLIVAPVVIRNSIAFQAFVPTGLGVGTNLWEGIGETSRAAEFGAVYGDGQLSERERIEQNLGDDPRITLYWPDGVARDRARMGKGLAVIASEPVWYLGVMGTRMWGLLKYAGKDSGLYGSTGINVTPARSLPGTWRFVPLTTIVTLLGWIQSVLRFVLLPLIFIGILVSLRGDLRAGLLLLSTPVYYLVFGTFLHSEIRYSLPMQAVLLVFAGAAVSTLVSSFRKSKSETKRLEIENDTLHKDKLRSREQWGTDPCGAVHGGQLEFGSREFFDEVERHRYNDYGPWMPSVMNFSGFPGKRLIEVGCGMGTDLLQFARGGADVTGVDLTPRSVEISRQHLRTYGMNGDFSLADAERLPFDDEIFDVFYSNGVLHHTPDTARTIREAHRVLKNGGTAKVMLYYRHSWNFWIELMLKEGVYHREFFHGMSSADIMSKYAEYNEGGGRPLVKVYSKREVRKLFSMFSDIRVEIDQLIRPEVYFVGKYIPEPIFRLMRRTFGWNIIITAKK